MLPSFLQNLDIKMIIFLGLLFGILGFFVWNKKFKQQQQQPVVDAPQPPTQPKEEGEGES